MGPSQQEGQSWLLGVQMHESLSAKPGVPHPNIHKSLKQPFFHQGTAGARSSRDCPRSRAGPVSFHPGAGQLGTLGELQAPPWEWGSARLGCGLSSSGLTVGQGGAGDQPCFSVAETGVDGPKGLTKCPETWEALVG